MWLLPWLVVALLAAAVPLEAQREVVPAKSSTLGTPQTEAVARAAFFRLRSPVTPSHTLDMCPAEEAEALRDTLRVAAAAGQTMDELVEGVIARYGEHMRILPQRRGAGLWAWVLPPAALLLGAGFLAFRLRSMQRSAPVTTAEPGDELSDDEQALLAGALAELEREGTEEEAA